MNELFENVLKLREKGLNYCEISRQTGVNRSTVMDWCKGKTSKDKIKSKHSTAKVDNELFSQYVAESFSVAEVLKKCDIVPRGGNYRIFYNRIKSLCLDTSHFTGQGHLKNKTNIYAPEKSIEESFVKDGTLHSTNLKRKILKYGLIPYICDECFLTEWRGIKLSLHLDHIDGDNSNNELSNLRFLCPNCHSLTETYCGKNKGKNK